jgi:uncharacterized protein YijF (DUF1287 family)
MTILSKIAIFLLLPLYLFAADGEKVAEGALSQVGKTFIYDSSYTRLAYPGGDVPMIRGVCTDVAIRALRNSGEDLQQLIHEDMKAYFAAYPNNWGLTQPDSNIDHRRVPNITTYYKRQGKTLPLPIKRENVKPGDLVAWTLPNNRPHIGVVVEANSQKVLIVHNIGLGAHKEAVLYDWTITHHIRP